MASFSRFALVLAMIFFSQVSNANWRKCAFLLLNPQHIPQAYRVWKWKRESAPYLREDYRKVEKSRSDFGIDRLRRPRAFESGHVVIHSAKNCTPSMVSEVILNSSSPEHPSWAFHNYDYNQDWEGNDLRVPKVVIYGARSVQFPMSSAGATDLWLSQMLRDGIELAKAPGANLVWRARTYTAGKWAAAGEHPDQEMLEDLDFNDTEMK